MPSLLDGVTRLGSCCVFLRTRSERRLLPSIYPSLLSDGVTLWVECGFPLTRSKRSFLWITGRYSFRMGSPFLGSDSNDLISIEGISTVGLLGGVFRLVLGMVFFHPGFVRLALMSGGVFHIQLSSFPVRTLCVSLSPTMEWVLALLLLALLPLALPSWVGLLRQSSGVSFTRAFFMRGYSAHGGSLATLPEVGLPG